MEEIDLIRFGKYIIAQAREKETLLDIFNTNKPTATAIQKEMDKREEDNQLPKARVVSAKTISKLLREETTVPSEPTLNFTAEFLNVIPSDIDDFCRACRVGEITEEDIKIPGEVQPLVKRNYTEIDSYIRYYPEIEKEVLHKFVGRQFVFGAIDAYIKNNEKGYFFIKAKPGVGKTALSIKLVNSRGYYFHIINPQHNGANNSVKDFIKNICAQLIVDKNIPIENFPDGFDQDGDFLLSVLRTVSLNKHDDEKIVIVVDGLDELDQNELSLFGKDDILYLPKILPNNIYFIITMRDIEKKIKLPGDDLTTFEIDVNGDENTKDIQTYIEIALKEKKIQKYLDTHNISQEDFIRVLKKKSEGNFMYLKYIFREIAGGDYKDKTLSDIPNGLEEYYKEHWNRMLAVSKESKNVKLKTIYVLSDVEQPISRSFLTDIIKSNIKDVDEIQIQEVLNDWSQFLNILTNDDGEKEYTFYHKSFLDFLASDEMIKAAGFGYSDVNKIIAEHHRKYLDDELGISFED